MFWFVCKSYFFGIVLYKYDIKSNCLIVLFELFPVFWVWWKIYFFPIILINKRFNFWYSLRVFPMFWWFNATVKAYWKQLSSLFFGFIVAFLFFNHSGESIYDPLLFKPTFWRWYYNKSILSGTTRFLSLVLVNVFDNFVKEIQKVFQ